MCDVKLLKKLQEAKRLFLACNIKKSGLNKYHKFKYYELEDIVPVALNIFEKLELGTEYKLCKDEARFSIIDLETGSASVYTCPVPELSNMDVTKSMQDIGKIQTYTRRYLYLQAFDIVETDNIDNSLITTLNEKKHIKELTENIVSEMEMAGKSTKITDIEDEIKSRFDQHILTKTEYNALIKSLNYTRKKINC